MPGSYADPEKGISTQTLGEKKNLGTHMSTGEKEAQKESHISIKITVEFDAIILLS